MDLFALFWAALAVPLCFVFGLALIDWFGERFRENRQPVFSGTAYLHYLKKKRQQN
jgi:hypothetical protein